MRSHMLRKILIPLCIIILAFIIIFLVSQSIFMILNTSQAGLPAEVENGLIAKYGLEKPPVHERFFKEFLSVMENSDFGMSWRPENHGLIYPILLILSGVLIVILFLVRHRIK